MFERISLSLVMAIPSVWAVDSMPRVIIGVGRGDLFKKGLNEGKSL